MKHQQAQTYQNIMSCQMNFARKDQYKAKALAQFLWSDDWTGFLPTELAGKTYPLEKMLCGGYCAHLLCSFPCPWLHLACERLCPTTVIGTHFRSAYVIHWGHCAPKVEVFGFWGGSPVFSLEAQGGPQVVAVGSLNASLSMSLHSDHLPYTSASWHHPGELEFMPRDPYWWSTIASRITLYRNIEQRQKIISLRFAVLKAWNPVQVEMCDLEWYETLKQK